MKDSSTRQQPIKKENKVVKRISTIFFMLVLGFVLVCIGSIIATKFIYNQPAAVFGYRVVKIITDSMSPEIPENSYILVRNVEGSTVVEGDIVVHIPAYGPYAGYPMTHKCIKGPYYDETYGQTCILTQGTKAGAPVDEPVPVKNVQSVFVTRLAKAGGFFDFLTSIWGIVVLIAVPSLVAIVMQIVRMVRAVMAKPSEEEVQKELENMQITGQNGLKSPDFSPENGTKSNDFADVMAYIARQKSLQSIPSSNHAEPSGPAEFVEASHVEGQQNSSPAPMDEMASVMAFIARQKAAATPADPDDKAE